MKTISRFALLSLIALVSVGSHHSLISKVAAQDEVRTFALTLDEEEGEEAVMLDGPELRMIDPGTPTPRIGFYGRMVANGLRVDRVEYDSLAYDIGLERGDVIMKVNGRRITSLSTYRRALIDAVECRDGRVNLTIENIRWHTGESSQRYVNRTVYLPVYGSGFDGGFGG